VNPALEDIAKRRAQARQEQVAEEEALLAPLTPAVAPAPTGTSTGTG
jgi:hypothetical protein